MTTSRILLSGIAATLLFACGIVSVVRPRVSAERPDDLARQAVGAAAPTDQVRAAARLAAMASRHRAEADGNVMTGLQDVLRESRNPEVRATAVVGLARTSDRSVLPLLVATIEDDDPVVAGRAVAAVQHLLGVRYEIREGALDRHERHRLAGMARADMAALDGPGRAWWESHTIQNASW